MTGAGQRQEGDGSVSDEPTADAASQLGLDAGDEIVVITGMSGAGRTEAAKVLEDLGWYVIDNLPPFLVEAVVGLAGQAGQRVARLALVLDARSYELFGAVVDAVNTLRAAHSDVRVLFLEASDDALVRRFEETRRRHPLAESEGTEGLVEGIASERELLAELRARADLVVDTSDLNVHELRDRLADAFGGTESARMRVNVVSFGYKHGLPRDADIVLDVRFLPNPHWVDDLRPHTGLDEPVRRYVLEQEDATAFMRRLRDLLEVVVPGSVAEGKRYLTIAIGCTGGRHRSVAIAEEVAAHLSGTTDLPVNVDHRDLDGDRA